MTRDDADGQISLFEGTVTVKKEQPAKKKVETEKSAKVAQRQPKNQPVPAPQKTKTTTTPKASTSGLVPEGDVRLTANIREDLHLRLKIAAAKQRTTIGELIEGLIDKYID